MSEAPIFSNLSSRSISLAMVTPSLVMVGEPKPLSRTACRPAGPKVIFTALATVSTPFFILMRAASSNSNCLAIKLFNYCNNVRLGQNEILDVINFDLVRTVFFKNDFVADLNGNRNSLFAVFVPLTWTDGSDYALFGFFLIGCGRQNYSGLRNLLRFQGLYDDVIA